MFFGIVGSSSYQLVHMKSTRYLPQKTGVKRVLAIHCNSKLSAHGNWGLDVS